MSQASEPIKSSGNIFADLGLENAEEELLKAQLAHAIRRLIQTSGFTQAEAARHMGTSQPKVSAILGGKLAGFTSDRLLEYVRALECDVQITITRKPADREHGSVSVVCTI
jgi:predicted XRE-type DNA-binding protein